MGRKSYSVDTIFTYRPTIGDYAYLEDDVRDLVDSIVKDSIKPNRSLRYKRKELLPVHVDLWPYSWSDIIELKDAIEEKNMLDALKLVYQIDERVFLKLDMFNAFAAYKWITEMISEMNQTWNQWLGGDISDEEKESGVEDLNDFDYVVSLHTLANNDLLKYDAILAKPYSLIFRTLCLNKKIADIDKKRAENASRKVKTNKRY